MTLTEHYGGDAADLYDQFVTLLTTPDPAEMPVRGHHLTYHGAPDRWERYRDLPMRYAATMRSLRVRSFITVEREVLPCATYSAR